LTTVRPQPRTLLEQLIQQRDATYGELRAEYDKLARRMDEKSTMSVRHLQRLAYGERQGQRSTPTTRRVMREMFGHSIEELLGPPAPVGPTGLVLSNSDDGALALADRLAAGAAIDTETVNALAAQTNLFRLMDRTLPGPALALQLAGHVDSIQWLLRHTVAMRHRSALAAELSDAEALAAWVALDTGDVDAAWRHHESARLAAREAESAPLLAHAMVQQAFVLTDIGDVQGAVDLVRDARQIAKTNVPRIMSAWLWASEGEVLAAANDSVGSRKAFDRAAQHLPLFDESELPYLQLDERHLARWHGNVLAKLGDPAAVDRLYAALDAPDQTLRARAALHTDIAYTLADAGDHRQARERLREADSLASRAGSVRQRRRVRQLATKCQYMQ
jgi:tetratricopeptide (TPR) repeat protein